MCFTILLRASSFGMRGGGAGSHLSAKAAAIRAGRCLRRNRERTLGQLKPDWGILHGRIIGLRLEKVGMTSKEILESLSDGLRAAPKWFSRHRLVMVLI